MVKDFGPEAQQAVNGSTQAALSNYRVRFIKLDVAVADALLTVRNVNGPDGTVMPVIPINFFYVAIRHADQGYFFGTFSCIRLSSLAFPFQ
jgi:hypothetical protein